MSKAKQQRERKMRISDGLTLAMGKIGWLVILGLTLIGLPVYGLHSLTGEFEYAALRWVATGLTLALVPAFFFGFWFGKVEVRGFLGGLDTALDKLAAAVDLRDTSRVRVHQATRPPAQKPQPNFNVYLPQAGALPTLPTITHKALPQNDDIVEL
ncbi:MAG: hypothetical protein JXA21_07050 [Anaerolineae bacterium]|nr:hypothetical protein [Anaerolineae bacterium]